MQFCDVSNKKGLDEAEEENSCCMLLKLILYKFKLKYYNFRILNVIPIVTTKKIVVDIHQKMRKKFKCFTPKRQLNTKEYSKAQY